MDGSGARGLTVTGSLAQHLPGPSLLDGSIELLDLIPQLLGLLLQGRTLLLQHDDVLGRLLQCGCLAHLQVTSKQA